MPTAFRGYTQPSLKTDSGRAQGSNAPRAQAEHGSTCPREWSGEWWGLWRTGEAPPKGSEPQSPLKLSPPSSSLQGASAQSQEWPR